VTTVPAVVAERDDSLIFRIIVSPRSSRSRFGPLVGDAVKVAVSEPPVDGKANAAVVQLVARTFGVRKAAVTLTAGAQGKRKNVRVVGATAQDLSRHLADPG
jgi:uncharacterized protein (TIGR00251 family)